MLAVALGVAVLTTLDSVMKAALMTVPLGQAVLMRFGFGALIALPLFLAASPHLSWSRLRANLLRAAVSVATALLFFHAVDTLPLAETLALTFLSPLFLALLAAVILREPVTWGIAGAVGLGFAGVLVISWSKFSGSGSIDPRMAGGIAAALGSAVLYALANVLLRQQAAHDPPQVLVFLQAAFSFLLSAPFVLTATETVPVGGAALGLFAAAGLLGTCGHICMAWGYGRLEAARLGPLEYTSFLWGALIGWAAFGESLAPGALLGAGLIVLACLLTARQRAAAPKVTKV